MSPRATCCLTISYSASVSLPGLRRIGSGMPILPTSWSRPGEVDRADELRVEAEPAGQEDGVAGDVLGVALRVAVLRVDREDQALEDVEAGRVLVSSTSPGRRPGWCRHRDAFASSSVRAAAASRTVTDDPCSG